LGRVGEEKEEKDGGMSVGVKVIASSTGPTLNRVSTCHDLFTSSCGAVLGHHHQRSVRTITKFVSKID
jgi:hypothetical protein